MIEAARDIRDLSGLPVWLIGSQKLEKQIAQRKIVAGRISQWVKFSPCDLEDTQLIAKELCLVEVQADLLEQLHKATKGSICLIAVGHDQFAAVGESTVLFHTASRLSRRIEHRICCDRALRFSDFTHPLDDQDKYRTSRDNLPNSGGNILMH